jgi:hypothetical protein
MMAQDKAPGPMIDSPMKRPASIDFNDLRERLKLSDSLFEKLKQDIGVPLRDYRDSAGCTMRVSIWGFVARPGKYLVPCETNMTALFRLCGGRSKGGRLDRVHVMSRSQNPAETGVRTDRVLDLSKLIDENNFACVISPELVLFPGDLIVIDGDEGAGD